MSLTTLALPKRIVIRTKDNQTNTIIVVFVSITAQNYNKNSEYANFFGFALIFYFA